MSSALQRWKQTGTVTVRVPVVSIHSWKLFTHFQVDTEPLTASTVTRPHKLLALDFYGQIFKKHLAKYLTKRL